MRARDLCQALDLPIAPKNTENIRSKLKRLASRGILVETKPGLFTQPRRNVAASLQPARLTQHQRQKGRQLANRPLRGFDLALSTAQILASRRAAAVAASLR
jgi:hypothetical protein